jgi:glycosyltransferase involved in cell wall biosynthesis
LTDASQVESPSPKPTANQVAFLIYSPYPKYSGGRENWLYNLTPYLRRRDKTVRIIALATNRAPFYSLDQSDIEVVALPSLMHFYRAFILLNRISLGLLKYLDLFFFYPLVAAIYLARARPSGLICMNPIPEGMVARLARVPYIVSVRSDVAMGISGPYSFLVAPLRWIEIRVLRRARKVLANGEDTRERLAESAITSTVVPNGVAFERFSKPFPGDAMGAELERRAKGRPVISYIATMQAIKGASDAIDCAAELKARGVDFLLAMVGKGDPGQFERRAESLGLDGWVEFLGETNSVPAVLQKSSVFLGLSLENGMSMSTLEAMAAGVPVVARNVLTYRQLIENEKSGLLGSTPAELAECCLRLLRDPDEAGAFAARAQAFAGKYDWPHVADIFLAEVGS